MGCSRRGCSNGLEVVFLAVFSFIVVPTATLFSIVSGVSLSVYSLKISIFFIRGTFSLTSPPAGVGGEDLCRSLLVSPLELALGAGLMLLSGALLLIYRKLMQRMKRRAQQELAAAKASSSGTTTVDVELEDHGRGFDVL